MRNGKTGAICDMCGEVLLPRQVIKIAADTADPDAKKAKTGCHKRIGQCGVCKDCYDIYFANYMDEPRRKEFLRTRKQSVTKETSDEN